MWRCRLTELNWVSTKIRFSPELMQFDTGISISRYLPAIGTAGLLRALVSGNSRVPRPPPRISEITRGISHPSPSQLNSSEPVVTGTPRGCARPDTLARRRLIIPSYNRYWAVGIEPSQKTARAQLDRG